MIIPNLVVTDLGRSVEFYRDVLGFTVKEVVTADRKMAPKGSTENGVFAQLQWGDAELMLQVVENFADDLPGIDVGPPAHVSASIYLNGYDHTTLDLPPEVIEKDAELTWYGMNELYVRDPDGHLLALGFVDGEPPQM